MTGDIKLTGSIGDMRACHMQRVDKIMIRRKTVISRTEGWTNQIMKYPPVSSGMKRLHNGRTANTALRRLPLSIWHITISLGHLNGLCKNIQYDDVNAELGARSALLSKSVCRLGGLLPNNILLAVYSEALSRQQLIFLQVLHKWNARSSSRY